MGGKYKKRLRAEKAKVKLKKKPLPKGQNITDTTFKVKKIITIEQLKKVDENEPVSSWNVPLKDLLNHLSHHNKSSRLNGLNGIKEVITNFPHILQGPFLRTIVIKILDTMNDVESKIRMTAINVLHSLFAKLDASQIIPFHDILNVHLACAMTHRQVTIQKDSLKLADIVIEYAPKAIKQNFKIIITNFIRILSTYKYGCQSELHLTRGSKKDLIDNRMDIFQRLHNILMICYPKEQNAVETDLTGVRDVTVGESNEFSLRRLTNQYKKIANLSAVFKPQVNDTTYLEDDDANFEFLVSQTMPLVLETWAEFSPSVDSSGFVNECTLKENQAKLLNILLQIILLFYERIQEMGNKEMEKQFNTMCGQKFMNYFLRGFPYLPQVAENKVQNSDSAINEGMEGVHREFLMQNLIICYIAFCLKIKISNELENKMNTYILDSLLLRNTKCEDVLCKIVEVLVCTQFRRRATDAVLEATVKAYKHTTNADFRDHLLKILTKISIDDKYECLRSNSCLSEWPVYLARSLCRNKIPFNVLQALSKIVSQKNGSHALREIESKFTEIAGNIASAEIEGCDQFVGKKYIANVLYWCDNSVIRSALTSDVLERNGFPTELKEYLVKIFTHKLNGIL